MDKDDDNMGIAIIYAESSNLGKWQFKTGHGYSFSSDLICNGDIKG